MKKSLFWLLCLGVSAAFAAVPEYLVVGDSPSRLERRAYNEIRLFYKQLYNKPLKVVTEKDAAGKSVIYLGNTAAARKNGFEQSKFDKEEWMLKSVDDDLIIAGGIPAGTLYGVYELMERLGVIFASYDETFYPSKPDFPKFNERRKPAVAGRLIYDAIPGTMGSSRVPESVKEAYRIWILRNRINGQATSSVKSHYCGDYYNLSTYPYHNLGWYVDPNIYFKTNPEYFQMDAFGKRIKPQSKAVNGCLCMSNPKVAEITLDTLRKFIKRDRAAYPKGEHPVVYDISELDATTYICRCPECKKIIAAGNESDLLFTYINKVAREIRKEYPDIVIRTSTRGRSPGKIKPESNVFIRVAHKFSAINPFYPYDPVAAYKARYADNQKNMDDWGKIVGSMQMWDYWNLGGNYFTPPRVETVFDAIQPDLKYFLKNKIVCVFYEASMDFASPQNFMMLNYYTANHLMVDPDMDVEKLADNFLKVYYGPAYPMMKKYFNLIRQGVKDSKQMTATSMSVGHWKYVTPEFMINMYQDLHKTERSLPADSRFARRVRHEIISPIWYALANWHNYEKAFKKINITHAQLVAECRALVKEFINRDKPARPQRYENRFEERFARAIKIFPRPEKFKNVPAENFRMMTSQNFRGVGILFSKIQKDPESLIGSALVVSDPRPAYHGVNIKLPGKHGFRSTEFVLHGHPDRVHTYLKAVAQDEKYHWYRLPGDIELKDKTTFWGHGWSVQGRANHWYTLTDGNPLDNMWDQVWMSAKFTGPAYVPGSQKPNAIYIDMVVITRYTKDNEFSPLHGYDASKYNMGKMPSDWTGRATVIKTEKGKAIQLESKRHIRNRGPEFACTKDDVVIVKTRSRGEGKVGIALFDKDGKIFRLVTQKMPDNNLRNQYVIQIGDLPGAEKTATARIVLEVNNNKVILEEFDVEIARKFNLDPAKNAQVINP